MSNLIAPNRDAPERSTPEQDAEDRRALIQVVRNVLVTLHGYRHRGQQCPIPADVAVAMSRELGNVLQNVDRSRVEEEVDEALVLGHRQGG